MDAKTALRASLEKPFLMHFQERDTEPITVHGEYSPLTRTWINAGGLNPKTGTTKQGPTNKRTYDPKSKTDDYTSTTDTYADQD